jgi:hypothetical protein
MKFLHSIAEVCLNLMHKKWISYMNLEPDTTTGNSKVRLTTILVTTCPLQFTHCADIRFLWHCLWNSIVTFTSSNSVLSDILQNTAPYKVQHHIFCSNCSALLHSFPGLALHTRTHAHTHTHTLRFPLQSSMCHWNSIYKLFSPCCLLAGLLSDLELEFFLQN